MAGRAAREAPPDAGGIYLDHAATTPPEPEAVRAAAAAMTELWANASSVHAAGRRARAAVETARRQVARTFGGPPHSWTFTAGGTEANNLAITGALRVAAAGRRRIVCGAAEHHSVLEPCLAMTREGWDVVLVRPGRDGVVSVADLRAALNAATALCALMLANNEVGAVQPVAEAAEACRAVGARLHVDAVAAAGRIPIDVVAMGVDHLSVSAHKFGGLQGAGALYTRPGLDLRPLLHGGGQERRWRPGTENVPGIVAMGAAAELAAARMGSRADGWTRLASDLAAAVAAADVGAVATGPSDPRQRLPGLLSYVFPGLDGEALLVSLDLQGIRAGAGAACTSGSLEPSHVLRAMGWTRDEASTSLRISLGTGNSEAEVPRIVAALRAAVALQGAAGAGDTALEGGRRAQSVSRAAQAR